ncbi:endolytic transglycosylase MltG [Streptomyces sp. NPDC006638]|uniref:endolytic transglycosylase MltG n=1 Tax=Streptomyces sp. NPDC006638 TaxID=3157183 RepID=UPI0033AACF5D
MTDYGRGPGSEPWHPEDPLYGDQGWGAPQAADGQGVPYGEQPQHPQQQYPQQGYDAGQAGQDPYQQQQQQQQYPQQSYDGGQQYDARQQYADPQPYQQNPQQYQDPQQYQGQQQYQQQPQGYGEQHVPHQQQYHPGNGAWDPQQQAAMVYGGNPSDPYAAQHQGGYPEGQDYYGAQDAYPQSRPQQPQPQQPQQPQAPAPAAAAAPAAPAVPENEWDAQQPPETHPFFTGDDDASGTRDPRNDDEDDDGHDDGHDEDDGRDGRDRRGKSAKKKKKGGNGRACLVLAVVLVGGVGGIGYVGYTFYQDRFGPPPDFTGTGTTEVQVEIPPDSGGYAIAAILVKNGVIKSEGAFVEAQKNNPKGNLVQAGVFTLRKGMSGENAVKAMLDPASHNALVIPEGKRNAEIYKMIDDRLKLDKGTTAAVAKKQLNSLGLPDWAKGHKNLKDPLEGFLYPASYPVAKGMKPESVLKKMVSRANAEYGKLDLEANAKKFKVDGPWEMITVASLVQVEGKTHDDFRKMAEVVYNRLKPTNTETNQKLQFDSSFNYLQGESNINISESEINSNQDPYNTYTQRGLPPGPISNPGAEALAAALDPTSDGWLYFVATDGVHKTEFAKTYEEFQKLKDKFNAKQGN